MELLITPPPRIIFGNDKMDSNKLAPKMFVKDAYGIFIDSGSPDSYLSNDDGEEFSNFLNESFFNRTFNLSITPNLNGSNVNIIGDEDVAELIIMVVTSVILGLMILITVIGNVFVIAAIILERNLQNVANYLVASLAVADLLVACLVMPLSAVYEISQGWILGPELCDIWTSCDVLCCTASILHLVAIATDRYWAVTNVDYIHSRTSGRVTTMISMVWVSSIIVSLAPQFGWKDPEYMQRIEQQKCMVSQDVAYQVFATCSTFYVPLLVILILYWKIYQTARKRIHRRRPKQTVSANNNQVVPPKTKSCLRFRLASKFTSSSQGKSAVSSLGLVEGNSTNTVNTVEETEYSSNEKKVGIEVTSFNEHDDCTPTKSQIATVSHQVAYQQATDSNTSAVNVVQNQITTPKQYHLNESPACTPTFNHQIHQHHQVRLLPSITTIVVNSNSSGGSTASADGVGLPGSNDGGHDNQQSLNHPNLIASNTSNAAIAIGNTSQQRTPNPHTQVKTRKETLEAKRERKAAKTLAIITGAFVVCWLPFFLVALLLPLCDTCHINDKLAAFFLWLGYFNSTLNPVIYTIFSPEFRQAFKRILFGTHRGGYYRGGKL